MNTGTPSDAFRCKHCLWCCKFKCCVLQVNEYPPGVGLSPHIDTHSAFEDLIFSLSLSGPCIMEFRRYENGDHPPRVASGAVAKIENPDDDSNFIRRAIYLPPRSLLLMSEEARYAWHHYIPHHKVWCLGNDYASPPFYTLKEIVTFQNPHLLSCSECGLWLFEWKNHEKHILKSMSAKAKPLFFGSWASQNFSQIFNIKLAKHTIS